MNAFIAIFHRTPKFIDNHYNNSFLRYLPTGPSENDTYKSSNQKVQIFSYAVRARFGYPPLIREADSACTIDGILFLSRDGKEIRPDQSSLSELGPEEFEKAIGEYSLVYTDGKELFATSDIGGSHSLYIAETEDLIAISNRSVCLLGVAGISHTLDENGLAWKAYQGYTASPYTAFQGIRKIRNGSTIRISAKGDLTVRKATYKDLERPEISEDFRQNPLHTFEGMIASLTSYLQQVATTMDAPLDLPLSGGKDSRVILGFILKAGLQDKLETIWTRGTLYSPEVLAAQDLCKAQGLEDLHEIKRPSYFLQANISSGMIVRTMNNHEGLLSVYDFAGIANWKSLRVQGHQNALRYGRFSKCRLDTFENFMEDALHSFSNPLGIALDTSNIEKEIQDFFEEQYQAGAPIEDLGDLHYLFERNPSWVAVLSNMDYCSGPISNPLMMSEMFRIAFNLPVSYRKNELFHFLSLYFNAPALLDCPFAEQVWPMELQKALQEIGLKYEGKFPKPYKSHKSFPNLKNPWIPNIKLDYFNAMKPFALDVLDRHKSYFSNLLDVDAFKAFLQETKNPGLVALYCSMGMYSALMLREYGSELFDRSMHEEIQKDLESRMKPAETESAMNITKEEQEHWEPMLTRHERSIAELVREIQRKP